MDRKQASSLDDDRDMTVKRYEDFLSGNASAGYFDVDEFESIIEYYLRKGKTKDSSKALEMGLQQHPHSHELQMKRAKIYLSNNHPLKALRILDALNLPDDYDVRLLKIETLLKLQREAGAAKLCGQVVQEAANDGDTDLVLLDIAYIYMDTNLFAQATRLLEQGRDIRPDNIDILFELAYCYEHTNRTQEAIDIYRHIVEVDPFVSEAWFKLGQIYFTQEDYAKALEAYV